MDRHPDCLLIQSQLQLHAGGDLTREEGDVVERHLERCPACAALAARARASRERLADASVRGDAVELAGASLWSRIAPQLEQEGWIGSASRAADDAAHAARAPAKSTGVRGRVLPMRRLLFAGGLAAALLCGGWWLATHGGELAAPGAADPLVVDAGSAGAHGGAGSGAADVELVATGPELLQPVPPQDGASNASGLRRMNAGERPFSDFAQDPARLRLLPGVIDATPTTGATPASARELR